MIRFEGLELTAGIGGAPESQSEADETATTTSTLHASIRELHCVCVEGICSSSSDGRSSSRRALPRLPHAGVESHGRVVVSPQALASKHGLRIRWNFRCVCSHCYQVGTTGATAFDAYQAYTISNVVQELWRSRGGQI